MTSNYSIASTKFIGNETLQVAGITVATVLDSGLFQPCGMSNRRIFKELQRLVKVLRLDNFIGKKPQNLIELCRALFTGNPFDISIPPASNYADFDLSIALVRRIIEEPLEDDDILSLTPSSEVYPDFVRATSSNRALFISVRGHIGVGPQGTKPGDIITVWLRRY